VADQVEVLDRVAGGGAPPLPLPPGHPLGRALDRVLRVGFDQHRLVTGMRPDRLEQRPQLRDLVGARPFPPPPAGPVMIHPGPADRATGIPQAGAVRTDDDHGCTLYGERPTNGSEVANLPPSDRVPGVYSPTNRGGRFSSIAST